MTYRSIHEYIESRYIPVHYVFLVLSVDCVCVCVFGGGGRGGLLQGKTKEVIKREKESLVGSCFRKLLQVEFQHMNDRG